MRSTFIAAALALCAPSFISTVAAASQPSDASFDRDLVAAPVRSRHATRSPRSASDSSSSFSSALKRHNNSKNKRRSGGSKRSKCSKASSQSPSSAEDNSSNNATSSSGSSSKGVDWDLTSNFLKVGNIYAGFLPDDGSGGGAKESMSQINAMLPAKSAWYGRYAQVTKGKTFDGSQIYSSMDDIKGSGAILAASVMPYGTWDGLTESDNHNAVAIAKVCADIYKTHGVEVWLRFAHEMNWYQVDGTYAGGVEDFQTGWKVVAAAIEEYAPETKLWWSPNVGSDADYEKYYPREGRVDVVGFDWYPNSASDSFYEKAQPFHDTYALGKGAIMVQGETGLHYTGSEDEKMQWVKSLSDEKAQSMEKYMGWMWFNYDKYENSQQIDFKIINPGSSAGITAKAVSFFSSS